jgi:glycerol kinase
MKLLLAIDQGTTGTTALVMDEKLNRVAEASVDFPQHFPKPGWVEHDPAEIWASVVKTVTEVTEKIDARKIAAIGITNQRETVVVWDRKTGKPVHRAIVWQDRRTGEAMNALRQAGKETLVQQRTGLLLDPYFSASKFRWILQEIPDGQARAAAAPHLCSSMTPRTRSSCSLGDRKRAKGRKAS